MVVKTDLHLHKWQIYRGIEPHSSIHIVSTTSDCHPALTVFQGNCHHDVLLSACVGSVSVKLSSLCLIVSLLWQCFIEIGIAMPYFQTALTVCQRNCYHNAWLSDRVDKFSAKIGITMSDCQPPIDGSVSANITTVSDRGLLDSVSAKLSTRCLIFSEIVITISCCQPSLTVFQRDCHPIALLSGCFDSISAKLSIRCLIVRLHWQWFSKIGIILSDCRNVRTVFHRNCHHNVWLSACDNSISPKISSQCLFVRLRWQCFSEIVIIMSDCQHVLTVF